MAIPNCGTPSIRDDGVPEHIQKVRKYHHQAYEHISKALKIDEGEGHDVEKLESIMFYRKGITELEKGMAIQLAGEGADYDRARNLQTKMKGNLKHAQSRVDELTSLLLTMNSTNDQKRHSLQDGADKKLESKVPRSRADSSGDKSKTEEKKDTENKKTVKSTKPSTTKTPGAGSRLPPSTSTSRVKKSPQPYRKPMAKSPGRGSLKATPKPKIGPSEEQQRRVSKLKGVDSKLAKTILSEVIENGPGVSFNDIGGVENAKKILKEIVILPTMRPELFTGLRAPARGVLLFGPPGNGKTLLAKAVATEAKSVFFNISASSLTSKWMGESEKLVRAMFACARELQPAIIFIDEVDSLLTERKESEHESSRRLKTEFLLCFDGVASDPNERILVMGATNRPWELDDAALRRLVKRVYVPLPDLTTRKEIIGKLLTKHKSPLSDSQLDQVARLTDGYSGSDLAALARDAALMPIRELDSDILESIPADKIRKIKAEDFVVAMRTIRPSVSQTSLNQYVNWNKNFGTI